MRSSNVSNLPSTKFNNSFIAEIKDIPTKRFSKYFDDESKDEDVERNIAKKYQSLTDRIFPSAEEQIVSDTTSIMPITMQPAAKQKRFANVPNLMLDNLPPRRLHYFSEDSQRSGLDMSYEFRKKIHNAPLAKKYDLTSYVDRVKQARYKGELHKKSKSLDKNIQKLGAKIFEREKRMTSLG